MIIKRCSQFSLLVVSVLSLCGAFSLAVPPIGELVIKGRSVQAPLALGALSVIHNKDGFSVVKDGTTSSVQTHCLDKSLRGMSQSNLKRLIDHNGYLRVNQDNRGGYSLEAQGRLQGGGAGGAAAGAYFGKFITHFVGQCVIFTAGGIAGLVSGGFATGPTIAALEATFLPTIEAISTGVALGCGIAGGVATGPV